MENTDGKGFVSSLKEVTDPAGKSVVVFGAGGAARAITVELALAGATRITVVNRNQDRGETLFELLNGRVNAATGGKLDANFEAWNGEYAIDDDTDIVINATSIGLYPDVDARLALDTSTLKAGMIVADVIPNPPKTNLVKDATARGCKVIDGLEMLVSQGVIGIEYWTGQTPDAKVMRSALEEVFG